MASFFDLKARKAAAANGASSTNAEKRTTENSKLQPWVEK